MSRKFEITVIFALLVLVPASASYAGDSLYREVLVLPHVEANEDFFTGLSLLNAGDETIHARLTAYGEKGNTVGGKKEVSLSPGERYLESVADVFGHEKAHGISWIKVEHNGPPSVLKGFGLLGNSSQLARIPLQSVGKETLVLPYVISGGGLFTQVYLLNNGSGYAEVTLRAYNSDGDLLASVRTGALAPGEKLASSMADIFGDEVSGEASWVKVESNRRLMGLGLVGTTDRLFSVPMD